MRKIAPALLVALIFTLFVNGETKEPFDYTYVVANYSCDETGKDIAVYSQVFGACYQETNHSEIASGQRDTYDQAAKASCGGDVTFSDQRSGYPYRGPGAVDKAEYDRGKDMRDMTGNGLKVESTFLQTPYSTKCAN
jgi:hypothetical protein